jgi:hypothetical protein
MTVGGAAIAGPAKAPPISAAPRATAPQNRFISHPFRRRGFAAASTPVYSFAIIAISRQAGGYGSRI